MSEPRKKKKDAVMRKDYAAKLKQIEEAVQFCKENNCRGKKALRTMRFPAIKNHKTIDRRLDGKIIHGEENISRSILLPCEEESLVEFVKSKCRALQWVGRVEMNSYIMNLLRLRRLSGQKRIKLSSVAKSTLEKGRVGDCFWKGFNSRHERLSKRRNNINYRKRIVFCTRQMAVDHITELATELIKNGIMIGAKEIDEGEYKGIIDNTRLYNLGETTQVIRLDENGAPKIVYCARGEVCSETVTDNKEYVTITPIISLEGERALCQVIFASKELPSSTLPESTVENIPNLIISSTESGQQDGNSFYDLLKSFDKYLTKEKIVRPVLLLCDGHTSRFNFDALNFAFENGIKIFLGPPDSKSVIQPLDQINSVLHTSYTKEHSNLFSDSHINCDTFMNILGKIWSTWVTADDIRNAFKQCGISSNGVSVSFMQHDKFVATEEILGSYITKQATMVVEKTDEIKCSLSSHEEKLSVSEKVVDNLTDT